MTNIRINGEEAYLCDKCGAWNLSETLCSCFYEDSKINKQLKEIMENMRAKNEVIIMVTPQFHERVGMSALGLHMDRFIHKEFKKK